MSKYRVAWSQELVALESSLGGSDYSLGTSPHDKIY